jgi:hypothetical protein
MSKTIFTDRNILKAYLDCRKRKRHTLSALGFECKLETNLVALTHALQKRTYIPDRSVYFVVTKPKPREIFASEFTDRITHHILINEVEKIWEKDIFIENSCACRKGKGHHYAMRQMSKLAAQYSYYGQFDISNFFSSIDKHILFSQFTRVIERQKRPAFWKEEILWLTEVIIFSDPTTNFFHKGDRKLRRLVPQQKSLFNQETDIGMPIGNLSSQFLANVYLHELDDYVLNTLKVPGYIRYVDDFVVLSNRKSEIVAARDKIKKYLLNELGMTLHPKKQQIQPTNHGIPFVGYFVKPTGVVVRRNVIKEVKRDLFYYRRQRDIDIVKLVASLNSYYGHFRQARSYRLRRHLFAHHLPKHIRNKLWIVGSWNYFKPLKRYLIAPQNMKRKIRNKPLKQR